MLPFLDEVRTDPTVLLIPRLDLVVSPFFPHDASEPSLSTRSTGCSPKCPLFLTTGKDVIQPVKFMLVD